MARERLRGLGLRLRQCSMFGLHQVPADHHPSYSRLSRVDCTGLCWLLQGAEVAALSSDVAVIRKPSGAITRYQRRIDGTE
jgi:hypothetical protein